jgi:hypothetical protein
MPNRQVLLISAFVLGAMVGGVRLYGQDCAHDEAVGHGVVAMDPFAYDVCSEDGAASCWVQSCYISGGGCEHASSGYICAYDMPTDLCDDEEC